jgi:hypothetical protein
VVRGRAGRTPAQGAAIRLAAPVSSQADLAYFADFVRSSPAKMVRLAELLTGDRGRAEDLAQDGYAKAYAAWTRIRGGDPRHTCWFEGTQPACLRPGSHGQHITFGVVALKPAGEAGVGGPVVVWVECARSPVPRYPIVTPKASGPP